MEGIFAVFQLILVIAIVDWAFKPLGLIWKALISIAVFGVIWFMQKRSRR